MRGFFFNYAGAGVGADRLDRVRLPVLEIAGVAEQDFVNNIDFNNIIDELKTAKSQTKFLYKVISSNLFKVFLTSNKKYLIISILSRECCSRADFIYFIMVFNIQTGKFFLLSRDILNPVGNVQSSWPSEEAGQLINNYNLMLNSAVIKTGSLTGSPTGAGQPQI